MIPGDHAGGALSNVPWDDFARNWKKHRSFFLEIGQKTWEIPFSSWYLAPTEQTCVQPAPEGMQGMLVGDVFFREYVVEFDMTEKRPILGIAPLNKFYKPAQTNSKVGCTCVHTDVCMRVRVCVCACMHACMHVCVDMVRVC